MKKVTRLLATTTLIAAGFFFAACSDSSDSGSNETAGGAAEAGGTTTGGETTGGGTDSGETTGEGFVKVPGKEIDGTETWKPESKVFVPGRKIKIRNLIVSDHEVTQGEYEKYCIYSGGYFDKPDEYYGKGVNYPVYDVRWFDAIVYCNLRSIAEKLTPVYKLTPYKQDGETDPRKWEFIKSENGKYCGEDGNSWDGKITMDINADGYRLPTEAEWEYLARGGETTSTIYSGSANIDEVAWYSGNSNNKTHEIRGKQENGLGLYDMTGNVSEWCWDRYYSDHSNIESSTPETGFEMKDFAYDQCVRGGAYNDYFSGEYFSGDSDYYNLYSVSHRHNESSDSYSSSTGFRVVRTDNSK